MRVCNECIYWGPWGPRDGSDLGSCTRQAPVIVSALVSADKDKHEIENFYYATRHPVTDYDCPARDGCACGEFQAMERD